MQIYYGRTGTTYRLAQELGAGGEGKVYEVEGKPNIIAKLYHDSGLCHYDRRGAQPRGKK